VCRDQEVSVSNFDMDTLHRDFIFHGFSQQRQKSSSTIVEIGHMRHFKNKIQN
jgi:hypothetical protein